MLDLAKLADRLNDAGIMNKSFYDCTREEIEALCNAVINSFDDSVPPEGWQQPCIVNGELIVGFRCHPKYHWWRPKGQSILNTLVELNAPWSVAQKYLDQARIKEDDYYSLLDIPF